MPRERLVSCLVSVITLLPNSSSDLLKRLNLDLLMHTRSEDARVRILALACATEMWKAEGGKLVGASFRVRACATPFRKLTCYSLM